MSLTQSVREPLTSGITLQQHIDRLDWECESADTRYLTHGMHRYSGKFIPQIAQQVIDLLTNPGDTVLDPYCGSGTTILESILCGRRAIGIDMNPLAVLLARVKCTPVPHSALMKMLRQLSDAVGEVTVSEEGTSLFAPAHSKRLDDIRSDSRFQSEWYRKWFSEHAITQLIGLYQSIMEVSPATCRDVALVAFSDILRRCSYAHSGYPNVMYDKRRLDRPDPAPLFLERLKEFATAITSLANVMGDLKADIRLGDARATALADNSVDAVVTHPPYIGSIPYAEYGTLSLTWLGYNPKDLDMRLTGGKRQARDVLERFQSDYFGMITESFRVLKPGRLLFVLVGHPLVKGKRIDLAQMSNDLANEAGFILVARRARTGMNRRANKMGDEDLLFYQKP